MSHFDKFDINMFINGDDNDDNCEHDDCTSLMDTAKMIMAHLNENYNEKEHKMMNPPCVTCVTFHVANLMGITIALRHPEELPLELRRRVLSDDFPSPF